MPVCAESVCTTGPWQSRESLLTGYDTAGKPMITKLSTRYSVF